MNDTPISEEKSILRKKCYARRMSIEPKAAAAAANEIAGRVVSEIDITGIALTPDTIVSGYWPLSGELDPRPAMKALASRNAKLALPRVSGDGRPLTFHLWSASDQLVEGRFKVMEPDPGQPLVDPTILLVPLLAFDSACHRLGHGKGYYDRTLAKLKAASPSTIALGIAFSTQEVDLVPTDEYDQTLDMVITENQVLRSSRMA